MRKVSINMLNDDMILAKDIIDRDILILKKGSKNIHRYAQILVKMGIHFLYIEDNISEDIKVFDILSDETRELCKKTLSNTMMNLLHNNEKGIDALYEIIEHIIFDVTKKDIQQSLTDIRTIDEYTFSHSVSATVYALMIGKSFNYNKYELEQLAIGTMLHDIGNILLDSKILYKKEKLSFDEIQYVKQHVNLGYQFIKERSDISEASKNIIVRHHERLDGSGYPNGIREHQIDELSRIAAIADVYDALISDRCYRNKWKTNSAVKLLLENSGTKFDADIVRVFMKNIAIFPNGSTVRLSDGRLALIKEQNLNAPLRPIIKVFADRYGRIIPLEEIDLMRVLSITIVDSELELQGRTSWETVDI